MKKEEYLKNKKTITQIQTLIDQVPELLSQHQVQRVSKRDTVITITHKTYVIPVGTFIAKTSVDSREAILAKKQLAKAIAIK